MIPAVYIYIDFIMADGLNGPEVTNITMGIPFRHVRRENALG